MAVKSKYATTVEQVKDDRFLTTDWSGLANTTKSSNNLVATSKYSVSGGQKYCPAQVYAHDFRLDLPDSFRFKSITAEVRIRGNNINTLVPRGYFVVGGLFAHQGLGYSDKVYSEQPNENLSDAFTTVKYTMDWSDITVYHLNKERVESDIFGILLQFNEAQQKDVGGVSIDWIKITVEYEEASYVFSANGGSYVDYMAQDLASVQPNHLIDVTLRISSENPQITPPNQVLKVDYSVGTHIANYTTSQGASYNPTTRELTVNFKENGSPYIKLTLFGRTTGVKRVSLIGENGIGRIDRWFFVEKGNGKNDDDDIVISSSNVRCWRESCFHFVAKVINDDGTAGFDILIDHQHTANELVEWKLDSALSSEGVWINESATTESYIQFYVPMNKEVEIHWTGVFLPRRSGDCQLYISAEDSYNEYTYDYTSLEPYTYVADVKNHDILLTEGNLVSQIETGAYVYDCNVDEYDCSLVQDKSTLKLVRYEDIDYIGCVALKQTHFNPKSTYKDTLLNTTYKNKTYMGKKGAIDETITLNVRLPPKDVTTMQGLVAMDKPVPINANHLCFEGDSLNHRGWAELYGITSEETNPHWYKCVLSVKYITHNLNTRFIINKGSKVSDYFLPELMSDLCEYGDDLTNNFYIETDGGYFYNKSISDYHMRNQFGLPSGKGFKIKSTNRLSLKSQVNLTWNTSRNVQNEYNDVSRIIRLVDAETENAVLEYEYYDIQFSGVDTYTCRVICRLLYKGNYKTILNRNLVLRSDAEYTPTDNNDRDVFGSEVIFKIVGDKLSIQDCGLSGKELYVEDIDLQNGQYFFDVEFKNNNVHGNAPDITSWIDIAVKELEFSSMYSNYYKNILVSPFAVPKKKVVYTRDSEEGTVFYLEDDGTECSYMVNPYYQYHCGVDLQSKDGISIFNLDNNYKTVYITNGLVRLGINRYTGLMTLSKYDYRSKKYVDTNTLQLIKYDDMNINSFDDDKLELQVSDTIITVWRGRPYIKFAHETEDILLLGNFIKIYADGVGNSTSKLPQMWNLVDNTNLLSECLGSDRKINADCWNLTESDYTPVTNKANITLISNGHTSTGTVLASDCDYEWDGMKFIIDGSVYDGTPSGVDTADSHRITHHFTEAGTHEAQAIYYKGANYYKSEKLYITVNDNAYKITPDFPSTMYYLQHDYKCTLTRAGQPVSGETVGFFINGYTYYRTTDSNGVAKVNNRLAPRFEKDGDAQPDTYVGNEIPYPIVMTYYNNSRLVARADKDATIKKGYVNTDVKSNSHNSLTVRQGSFIMVSFRNTLDPNDDDVELEETYVTGKTVTLSVNGRDYVRTTDSNGQCRLNINLNPANYDLKVSFAGDNYYMGTVKNYELKVVAQ